MTERIQKLITRLNDHRAYLEQVLEGVRDRWETQVYDDGERWTVRQVLIHLADAHKGLNRTTQNIASGGGGVPADFDVERFNARIKAKHAETPLEQARADLNAARAELIAWLNSLDPALLDQIGRHPVVGEVTLEKYVRIMGLHERDHANDIARALNIRVDHATESA